jgi:hypothetical protein
MVNWNPEELKVKGYKINDRKPRDIEEIFMHLDKFSFPIKQLRGEEIVYSGAEHTGKPKLPNITFLPNIHYANGTLIGSTFGHQHTQNPGDIRLLQEIYEFQSYGGILLRKNNLVKLILLRPGEKVSVGTDENMTLFNFGERALLTEDYANPTMNSASKDLEKSIGPLMAIWETPYELTFRINPLYREQKILDGERNNIHIKTNKKEEALYEKIKKQRVDFLDAGIEVYFGEYLPKELKTEFSKPLRQLVDEKNESLMQALQMK